jgi:hypothetical protein
MLSKIRQERILREGSEFFTIKLPAINAGDFAIYDIDTSSELAAARKYKPLDYIEITNNDTVDVRVMLNFQDEFVVPKSVIKTISERPIYSIKILNIGASATTVDKIVLTLQKMALTTDQYYRRFKLGSRSLFDG